MIVAWLLAVAGWLALLAVAVWAVRRITAPGR